MRGIMGIKSVCVFCASSSSCHPAYLEAARRLGGHLAQARMRIVYGGGSTGLMGALADGALDAGGNVVGVLPHFMEQVEWGHEGVSEMRLVDDMHDRVKKMKELSDAFVALPGGSGTFDELFQAISWKRLGLHVGPIVLVNLRGYFDPCLVLLEQAIAQRFMDERHASMWTVVQSEDGVLDALREAPAWDERAIDFAIKGRSATGRAR
jgi:uncharacterized protein (TIGR00730 family)